MCEIEDQDRGMGATVVHGREGIVAFLSGCVPEVEAYRAGRKANGFSKEACPDGRFGEA